MNNPEDLALATRHVPFSGELWIEEDPDSRSGVPVWNRTVTLKDTSAKIAGRQP